VFREHEESVGGTSVKKQHEYIKSWCLSSEKESKLMSYVTFNDFMRGKRKAAKPLILLHQQLLKEFVQVKRRAALVESSKMVAHFEQ